MGDVEPVELDGTHKGEIDLIVTFPPFPLVTKKQYGSETGARHIKWLEYGAAAPVAG